ncbi:uncharacterized protein LOC116297652 [Actinia tenebrosa]|uniref:Uncharacterized protein LOC116297652 n=1 Tax=Actinia tenebrosa TaxID=6105 RepID=A0A6P8IAP1_ACTTE|nr:uncharacterized protein LOC116297652 [Actinia tenebrosa]
MKASRSVLFFLLWSCLFKLSRLESFVDITRNTDGDIFSNPVSKCDVCEETVRTSCEIYDNVKTGGKCVSFENCCKECVCSGERSTYLRNEKRCISNGNLTTALFHNLNQGCSFRLVPNSYYDNRPRGRQPCLFSNLRLHALNTTVSGSQMIDVCGIFSWSITSCSVLSGAQYHNSQWTDLWGVGSVDQDIFSVEKSQGVNIFLKWNNTLPSRYHGDILSLDIRCYRKYNRGPVESCLLFKVKGTQMDTRPSTTPSTNFTGAPTNVESRGKQKSSNATIIIIVSVICALIFLVLICVVILCVRKRRGLCKKNKYSKKKRGKKIELRQKSGKHITIESPTTKNEVKEYQCVNHAESPVYTTPAKNSNKANKTAEYHNLLQAIASTPHYHPLVGKDDAQTPRSSSPPYYHEPEKPGNKPVKNDNLPHFYHVLEGPSFASKDTTGSTC